MQINRYVLLVLSAAFYSLNFIVGKLLAGAVPPAAINFLRWFVAIMVFLPLTWLEIRANLRYYLSKLHIIFFLALTGYCLNGVTTYYAVNYTTAINASLIQSFNPIIFTLLAFVLYREKVDAVQIIGIFVSLLGTFWLIFRGDLSRLLDLTVNPGDVIMLLSVCCWAFYSLVYKKKAGMFSPRPFFTLLLLSALLFNFILMFYDSMRNGTSWVLSLNSSHVIGLVVLNIFPTLLAFVCWNTAVVRVKAGEAAVFLNLVPFFVTIVSILALGETLLLSSLIGGAFIILGVVLVTNSKTLGPYLSFVRKPK